MFRNFKFLQVVDKTIAKMTEEITFFFAPVRECANPVDLEKSQKHASGLAIEGQIAAENEPYKDLDRRPLRSVARESRRLGARSGNASRRTPTGAAYAGQVCLLGPLHSEPRR